MTTHPSLAMAALMGLALCGCAHYGGSSAPTADAGAVIRGTVAYRERVALPADAVLEVWITDVSPQVTAAPVIAETTVRPEGGQVPIPFELPYDLGKIDSSHTYGIRAAIRGAGGIMFATDSASSVITQGHPTHVTLWVKRAATESGGATGGLVGTRWRLEDLAGAGVVDGAEATLEFPEAGKVGGNGSCNRFSGTVVISGDSLSFGPLGSTRMSCAEAVGTQETTYLKALQDAERFTLEGSLLLISSKGMDKPLRFARKEP